PRDRAVAALPQRAGAVPHVGPARRERRGRGGALLGLRALEGGPGPKAPGQRRARAHRRQDRRGARRGLRLCQRRALAGSRRGRLPARAGRARDRRGRGRLDAYRRLPVVTVAIGILVVVVFLLVLFAIAAIKVAREYERGI